MNTKFKKNVSSRAQKTCPFFKSEGSQDSALSVSQSQLLLKCRHEIQPQLLNPNTIIKVNHQVKTVNGLLLKVQQRRRGLVCPSSEGCESGKDASDEHLIRDGGQWGQHDGVVQLHGGRPPGDAELLYREWRPGGVHGDDVDEGQQCWGWKSRFCCCLCHRSRESGLKIFWSLSSKELGVKIFLICIILCKTLCETVDDKTDGGKMFELF